MQKSTDGSGLPSAMVSPSEAPIAQHGQLDKFTSAHEPPTYMGDQSKALCTHHESADTSREKIACANPLDHPLFVGQDRVCKSS